MVPTQRPIDHRVGDDPVVVVGAGSAGLSVAAALQRRGIPAVVLERGAGPAESWRHRHADLRLNTVRWHSDLQGYRMPRSFGRWVARDDYVAYLVGFAAHHRLDIRTGVDVETIKPARRGWQVVTSAGVYRSDDVVIATGHERVPRIPTFVGRETFTTPMLHVADLRRAADLAGRRTLLVGAGNSGIEMAGHLVDAPVAQLWLSVRTPPTILPREMAGIPLQAIGPPSRFLPEAWRDAAARTVSRRAFGDLAPYGLPAPAVGPYRRLRATGVTAAVDQGFVAHLKSGRVAIVPPIERLDGTEVALIGGRRLRPDVVVLATGYEPQLADLVDHPGALGPDGLPQGGSGASPATAPGLCFAGYETSLDGNLRIHPIEARRIARSIRKGKVRQPISAGPAVTRPDGVDGPASPRNGRPPRSWVAAVGATRPGRDRSLP